MATLSQIRMDMPCFLLGRKNTISTDPDLVSLSKSMNMPQLLHCLVPVDGAEVELSADDLRAFLAHVMLTGRASRYEQDLQCVAEDATGRPLLTTWIPLTEFEAFVREVESDLFSRLLPQIAGWNELGVEEVDISAYAVDGYAHPLH